MKLLSSEDFARAAHQVFDLDIGGASLPLTLVDVQVAVSPQTTDLARAPFCLFFRSAAQVVLPQKTYTLRQAEMGVVEIFLVPVGRDREGVVYQAVFS